MAATRIQGKTGSATSTTAVSIALNSFDTVTGDVVIVAMIANATANRTSSITATGMSFALLTGSNGVIGGDGLSYVTIWYAYNVTGATTPTLTINKTASCSMQAVAFHVRGLTTTDPFDKVAKAGAAASTAISSGNTAALSQADEYIIGVGASDFGGATYTVGATYGNLTQRSAAAGDIAMQDKSVAATTAVSSPMTLSDASDNVGVVATFKIDTGGAVVTPTGIFMTTNKFFGS